jgi:hypothetical protein
MNIYGFAPVGGGCHWYRIREPLRGLAGLGHATEFGEYLTEDIVRRNDTILTHILHDPAASEAWQMLADAGQHKLVYDIDDNIWSWEAGTDHWQYWSDERQELATQNMKLAHLVTTPSMQLADFIRSQGINDNVAVLPNCVPAWTLALSRTKPAQFTIGYQGAPQKLHQSDLDTIQEPLFNTLAGCPRARLIFFGQPTPLQGAGPFADRIEYVPWNPDVPAYYRSLYRMTVGIGPLKRSNFTSCKSGIRAVEFHALGIPGVYAESDPYRPYVFHERTGFLANRPTQWEAYLKRLYRHPELVATMSVEARNYASGWTTEANARLWHNAYERSGPGRTVSSV